ncbi:MAG: SDR family NAD(P)-dependent oxidoreductase [Bacteroidota bacterium]
MILVTGGTGLIGSHLLLELVKSGHLVKAIYRTGESIKKVAKIFSYYGDQPHGLLKKITWVNADITDAHAVQNAMQGVEAVYHCAALISFDPSDYHRLVKNNIEGTAHVVNACLTKKVNKLCYVSSIAAIGPSYSEATVDEHTEWNDSNATVYGLSKYHAEMEVWRGAQEGLSTVIVNPGVVLGPGFWKSGSGTFFHYASKGHRKTLPGGTGFISVVDVVKAMVNLMDSSIQGERFILVGENHTYLQLLQKIAASLGVNAPQKTFPFYVVELLWRVDWLRSTVLKKRRRLPKSVAKSLYYQDFYDASKLKKTLRFEFSDLEATIAFCSARFKEDCPELF